jgi:AcrR family transcriptional regulator
MLGYDSASLMAISDPPRRADAQRNRETILTTGGRMVAEDGDSVQMHEVAKQSGLGLGTLYRHFPTKAALLAAIVAQRFEGMTSLAQAAASIEEPGDAFQALVQSYLEEAAQDAGFRLAMLGQEQFDWADLAEQKEAFVSTAQPIISRAVEAGYLRPNFEMKDFILITRGVMTNMTPNNDWRRHLELSLEGVHPSSPYLRRRG